ncbi:MAG: DUF4838 domain-containing protein [Clostridia bacterium]|nr:DUF4838 domain-containing protein [Clostridia bacterium]
MLVKRNSEVSVIIPQNASPRERFAAEDLKKYLLLCLNCNAVISEDTCEPDGFKILIGAPSHNKITQKYISDKDFDARCPGPEGMMIKALDTNTLLIAGSVNDPELEYDRGTVYAVYEFLERYAGASLSAYVNPDVAGGEEIPTLDYLDLNGVEYIKKSADNPYRTAIVQYGDAQGDPSHKLNLAFLDWLVKNRYNRILTWGGVYDGFKEKGYLEEADKRGLRFSVGHHAATQMFLPPHGNEYFPEHYFETHPEFYKLMPDGTRFHSEGWGGQWILCSRNEELIKTVADNIISWISQNPLVDIIAFWPQDGMGENCQCDECRKHSKLSNYTHFLNSVAKRVAVVYPHVKMDMLTYVDLWSHEEGVELDPHLIVDEATWHVSGLRNAGARDGSGLIGTFFERDLLEWHKFGAEVVYYDYYMAVYPSRQRLIPMADEIQPICRRNKELGIMGSGTQIECYNMWNHIFNYYCFGRTAYDNDLGVRENLARFTRIFGKASETLAEIIRLYEEAYQGEASILDAGWYFIEHIDKDKIYSLYDKALDKADTPAHRNNIRMMRMAFRYTDVECRESIPRHYGGYYPLHRWDDPTGELWFMSRYDSFKHNDPGFGITIPVDIERDKGFVPDRWYDFE